MKVKAENGVHSHPHVQSVPTPTRAVKLQKSNSCHYNSKGLDVRTKTTPCLFGDRVLFLACWPGTFRNPTAPAS